MNTGTGTGTDPDRSAPGDPTTVTLTAGDLQVDLVSTGAAVTRLLVGGESGDGPGQGVNVVLGHQHLSSYREVGGYLGTVVGRCANRIDGGRLPLGGTTHQLVRNDRGNTLHGGADGLDRREWRLEGATGTEATWSLTSPDGDQGFPGTLQVRVRYAVAPGVVSIDYTATTDAPTPVNLTNHAFFALDGEGAGDTGGHLLGVDADAYLPTREDQIPTGEVRDVEGTPFDLREAEQVSTVLAEDDDEQVRIAGGIDHHYVVPGEGLRRHATLVGRSGRRLEVWSDQRGIQVYTGAHFDGTLRGTSGAAYQRGAGIALETQGFPDAVNHESFPSVLLRPGQTYRSRTEWHLT